MRLKVNFLKDMITNENAKHELYRLRCKYGKTQEQVRDGSGVSKVTIGKIENGSINQEKIRATIIYQLNTYFRILGEEVG